MKTLSTGERISLGFMLFSIFFGAGNLIFPPALGQLAGTNYFSAITGFLITGVGLPFLGVLSVGLLGGSFKSVMSKRTHPVFITILFTILYLTIGPLFAIPRTGAVAFEIGLRSLVEPTDTALYQFMYTLVFFGITYWVALNPHKIVDRIGKILTPLLLLFLIILLSQAFISPLGAMQAPIAGYRDTAFLQGFQDGYLTMDLLASLSFGAIVINAIMDKGVTNPIAITKNCLIAGVISVSLMSLVYVSLGYMGATGTTVFGQSENGGVILAKASSFYFGTAGTILLAFIITFACLTTSCGLVAACSTYFNKLTGGRIKYSTLALVFSLFSMAAANVGLSQLIAISVPFLVMIYPIVIVLVLLTLMNSLFQGRYQIYHHSLILTFAFSLFNGLEAANLPVSGITELFQTYLPLYTVKLGWVVPAIIGIITGYIHSCIKTPVYSHLAESRAQNE